MDLERNLQVIVQKIIEAAEGYEFRSFVLGFLRPPGGRTPEARPAINAETPHKSNSVLIPRQRVSWI